MIDTNKARELAQEIKAIGDSGLVKPVQDAAALLLALADAHDSMAKDAARYRWLRDKSLGQRTHPIAVSQSHTPIQSRYVGPLCGGQLDTAIDAAMGADQRGNE